MTGPLSNADRLVLTSSLVPYLRSSLGRVTIAQAAEHFRVPEEEIERSVRLIACSGAPGETGCYLDSDLFDIDWEALERDREIVVTRFVALQEAPAMSAEEVSAVLAGLQVLRCLPGIERGTEDRIDGLVSLLRGQAPPVGATPPDTEDRSFQITRQAVHEKRRLIFSYSSPASDDALREVDPVALDADDGVWYLRGWCLTRDAERSFRLDRMRDVQLAGPAQQHEDGTPLSGDLFPPDREAMRVTLEAEPAVLPLLRGFLEEGAIPANTRGPVRVTIRIAHPASLVRTVAMAGGRIRIMSPAKVREAVAAWARSALDAACEQ